MNDNGTVCIMLSAIIEDHRFEMYMVKMKDASAVFTRDCGTATLSYAEVRYPSPRLHGAERNGEVEKKFLKNISVEQICP